MTNEMHQQQAELAELMERHCHREGSQETAVPSLYFVRYSSMTEPDYGVYKPCFCVIANGSKQVLLAQERFVYNPADYLIASLNLPVVGQVINASPDAPYLSFKLEFTHHQIMDTLTEADIQLSSKEESKRALFVGQIEAELLDATLRLARLLDSPKDIPFLAPMITREILYRLLQGPHGARLAQIALEGSSTYRIRNAIEQITQHYDEPLRVDELAQIANMSVSTFHRNFKEVTAMSPLQFMKELRLQEARRLLMSESAGAADVAFRVGYESPSQFSREYARMFGAPPIADMKRLKEQYEPAQL